MLRSEIPGKSRMGRLTTLRPKLLRLSSHVCLNGGALSSSTVPSFYSVPRDHHVCHTLRYCASEKPFLHSPSKRRVENSPTLPLEAVALPALIREQVQKYISRHNLTARQLRANATTINSARAPESLNQKYKRNLGQPTVLPTPIYDNAQTAAFAAIRMPGTYTANVFVMAEAARLLPDFSPSSILDFGSGPGTSLLAASRVFSPQHIACSTQKHVKNSAAFSKASLVDNSSFMRSLAAELASADPTVRNTSVTHLSDLRECSHEETFDIVSCSYSLHEIVRDALSSPPIGKSTTSSGSQLDNRENRVRVAEARLLRTAKLLWSRTAPMGLFIVVEDGTAAGFETISLVRDFLLKTSAPLEKNRHGKESLGGEDEEPFHNDVLHSARPNVRASVVAPCLHSVSCPLSGSITRHRLCRFQQRLNRPQFSRTALPMSTGYEDERFSFLVVQKIVGEKREDIDSLQESTAWGRLIREPLQSGKHVTLDACTREANLERRVVAKKNAEKGMYSLARRAKWGDVWPHVPSGAPQQLNF